MDVLQTKKAGASATDTIDRVANDPILLCDILWVLCEQQAKADGVTDEDFGSSLAGDSIETATRAFLDELVDFFSFFRRLILRKAGGFARKYEIESAAAGAEALESPEFEERMKTLLSPRGGSPGSPESTQAPSP